MRRILLFLLLLVTPLTAEEPDALSQLQDLYRYASLLSMPYGNYAADLRVIAAQRGFYEALRKIATPSYQAEIDRVLGNLEALRLQALAFSGQHQAVLGATLPKLEGDQQLIAWMALVYAARESARPDLVQKYLPPLTRALEKAKGDDYLLYQFAARTFAMKRKPTPTDHDRIWSPLKGKKLLGIGGDSRYAMAAARWWMENMPENADRDLAFLKTLPLNSVTFDATGALNACHEVALLNMALDRGPSPRQLQQLAAEFEARLPVYLKADEQTRAKLKEEAERLEPLLEAYPKIPYDPKAVQLSILEGDISRTQARLYQLQARANPAQAPQLLARAEEAQRKARAGQGFLGLDDVRWDLLRLTKDETLLQALEGEQQGFLPGELEVKRFKAELLAARGQRPQAIALLTEATAQVEKYAVTERFRSLYDALTRLQVEEGQAAAALETLARRQQMTGVAAAAQPLQLERLRGQAEALGQEVAVTRALGGDARPAQELLAKTKAEFFTALSDLRRQNPRYESLLAVRPVNYAKQQASIPEGVALVQYLPADDALYIFVVTRSELKIHKVGATHDQLQDLVAAFRQSALGASPAGEPAMREALTRLHNVLLDPIEGEVQKCQVLAFIPTSVLCYVPFSALLGTDGHYLAEKKQCVTLLKSSDVEQLGRPAVPGKGGVLALGNPDGSLPAATDEANQVAALFKSAPLVGPAASSKKLAAGLKGASYVHLATHGRLDPRDPAQSYLVLAGGDKLSVANIYDLKLQDVRLVTLSACQTALVAQADPGSELQSLADAFSVAGANSVVASLWSVSDESTRQLMVEFYRQLRAGATLASALNTAELALLNQPRTKHPFHWAPFVLIGDWR